MAASPGGREAIEQEMDETRERLSRTIDQLVHRTSPKTIVGRQVSSVRDHFVDRTSGQPRTDNILKVAGGVVGVIVVLGVIRRIVR
ncbi:MAG: hypothetical protein JWO46_2219 [Nocardioidaceae bacterium]|nr:hypothetical protein [Nocardioidaceae bacterium]